MFKKLASEALGLSDIGKIIAPGDYNKVDSDDYIFHEDNEQIFFLIKSKKDEYCFTNRALIHVDGASAVSSKRVLKRYEYSHYTFRHVLLETAGTIDLDAEIKFQLGEEYFSIDVDKQQIEQLKDLYKALFEIAHQQYLNMVSLDDARKSLELATSAVGRFSSNATPSTEFEKMTQFAFQYIESAKGTYQRSDFTEVFQKFINN